MSNIFEEYPKHDSESNAAYVRRLSPIIGKGYTTVERYYYDWKNTGTYPKNSYDKKITKLPDIQLQEIDIDKFEFIDEKTLMEKHNMFFQFEQFLQSIPKGKYARETDVLKMLGLNGRPGYRAVIDHPDYKIYKGTADGIVYYGHPESIEQMKRKTTLK